MIPLSRIPAFLLCACCVQAWCQEAPEVDDAIFAFIHDHQRRVRPAAAGDGFTAINPDMGLWAAIDPHGFALAPVGTTDWRTHLRIDGLGRAAGPWLPWEPGAPSAVERELTWAGRHMDVQYVNGDDGLRQNFIVHERPAGHGPMRVGLTWASDLDGAPLDDGTGAVFTDAHGEPRHVYKDLHVFDACGRVLAAWMEVDPGTRTISLHVDDHQAEYPVTVDPISTTYNLQINMNHVGLGIGTPGTQFGYAVCSAGDLNGDGYGDIAIGAFKATFTPTVPEEGAVYVFYGSPTGITIAGHTLLVSNRLQSNFGISVAHAGDVNGDGYSDLVIGGNSYALPAIQLREGAVWVFFGSPAGVTPTDFQMFESDRPNTFLGYDVAGLGDINGDGYSDFAGGCSLYSNGQSNEGAVYVFMGSADIATDGFTPVHILEPDWVQSRFGSSVAGAGDINGDGYDDMVVGAFGYDLTTPNSEDGAIMVYYGSPTVVAGVARPFGTAPTVVNPAPGQLFNAHAETGNLRTGWAVAGAGDVNGDGYSDVIVGDWTDTDSNTLNEGGFMVFHGTAAGLDQSPATVVFSDQLLAAMGHSVASAGDVNADGYADVMVGMVSFHTGNPGIRVGAVRLYLGGPAGITGTHFLQYAGGQNGGRMGTDVSSAGDVNGDGFSDFILSLPGTSTDPNNSAEDGSNALVRVVHGGGHGLWLNTMAQTPPPRIDTAAVADGHAGWSVANAGDVNGDGLTDVIVGLPDANGGTGQVHIYHGTPTGPSATPVLVFSGAAPGDRYGASVATAGDVNGDGYADVVIGAPGGSGRVTVHLGGPGGVATDVATVLTGTPGSLFGAAVSTAGDVNCDGMADVIVGAPGAGMVHVHQGSPTGLLVPAALSIPAPQPGSGFGTSVATAGDVNGDGYSDIIIGAPDFSNGQAGEGAAFVHLGSPDGVVPAAHRQLEGNVAGLAFGTSVAGAGDVNGNGCSDVVVGAPMHTPNGAIHVFHGSLAGLSTVADHTYAMPGGAGNAARFGTAVAEGGDIDGNGLADIIVGAPYASDGQANEGRLYVLLSMPVGAPDITYQESNVAGRRIGWSVAGGGDIDGDGFSDIIAGAPFTIGTDGTETGAVYFYPGNAKKGLSRPARQYQADLVSPLSTNSEDYMNTDYFGVGLLTRSHMQRKPGRLHWEVVHEGMPFTGAPNIATSVVSQGSTPYVDLGLAGVEIKQLLYKQPGFLRYKWRVRAEYPLYRTAADGQRFGKWHYGYASAHGDIGVLPVELLQLDGVPLVPGNLISWATASETGTSHFTVERSTDLAAWQAIGEVAAAGTSPTTTAYELLDTDAPTGLSYYRLQVVDLDGTVEPSPTVAVHRGAGDRMQVYPNPATDARLYWQGPTGVRRARVHDAAGRMVLDRPAATGATGSIELGALSAGHYTLLLVDAQGRALARAPFIRP